MFEKTLEGGGSAYDIKHDMHPPGYDGDPVEERLGVLLNDVMPWDVSR